MRIDLTSNTNPLTSDAAFEQFGKAELTAMDAARPPGDAALPLKQVSTVIWGKTMQRGAGSGQG